MILGLLLLTALVQQLHVLKLLTILIWVNDSLRLTYLDAFKVSLLLYKMTYIYLQFNTCYTTFAFQVRAKLSDPCWRHVHRGNYPLSRKPDFGSIIVGSKMNHKRERKPYMELHGSGGHNRSKGYRGELAVMPRSDKGKNLTLPLLLTLH